MMATFFALLLLLGAPFQNLLNKSRYPLAFPRDGAKKVMQTDRVIVWDYTWTPNKPTPMHFHDKDVVVVFMAEGQLNSTTADGKTTPQQISYGFDPLQRPGPHPQRRTREGSSPRRNF